MRHDGELDVATEDKNEDGLDLRRDLVIRSAVFLAGAVDEDADDTTSSAQHYAYSYIPSSSSQRL